MEKSSPQQRSPCPHPLAILIERVCLSNCDGISRFTRKLRQIVALWIRFHCPSGQIVRDAAEHRFWLQCQVQRVGPSEQIARHCGRTRFSKLQSGIKIHQFCTNSVCSMSFTLRHKGSLEHLCSQFQRHTLIEKDQRWLSHTLALVLSEDGLGNGGVSRPLTLAGGYNLIVIKLGSFRAA
jgi:hypothetical protein